MIDTAIIVGRKWRTESRTPAISKFFLVSIFPGTSLSIVGGQLGLKTVGSCTPTIKDGIVKIDTSGSTTQWKTLGEVFLAK